MPKSVLDASDSNSEGCKWESSGVVSALPLSRDGSAVSVPGCVCTWGIAIEQCN